MPCPSYALGEAGIVWALGLRTEVADGDPVAFTTSSTDRYTIEFRTPSGLLVPRPATYADGTMTYDQGNDTSLLSETGLWTYRAVITRRAGAVIKSPYAAPFWVVE